MPHKQKAKDFFIKSSRSCYTEPFISLLCGVALDIILDTEDGTTTTVSIGDNSASLIVKDDVSILMWENSSYLMLLSGDFTSDEIIKIASGITVSK